MDKGHNKRSLEGIEGCSMIQKAAQVQPGELTAKELAQINKLTLEPLAKEDVFTFKVAMCDNEIDRQYEVFPLKTLQELKKLYVGKTVIKDHTRSADNQVARIYATELKQDGSKTTKTGELYTQLVAHCYMLNNDANKQLISEIKAGIKKEVSVGCAVEKAVCSICGTDNRKDYCRHYWGKSYDNQVCHFKLENARDAYELSFVAVPAQPGASTIKMYGAQYKDFSGKAEEVKEENIELGNRESELSTMLKSMGSFLFTKKQLEEQGMNKKMRELLAKIEQKHLLAKGFMEGETKDLEKADSLLNEADELEKEFRIEERLFNAEKSKNTPDEEQLNDKQKSDKEKDVVKEFANAARNGFRTKSLNEGTPADGGYAVPEDILTRINTYREAKASLKDLVRVENVKTNKGSRTFKKRAQQTGFTKVGEGGKIGAKATPQFERISYEIDKYAGYFPVTNELLSDSDQNIVETLTQWIGDESRVTANKLILEQIATKDAEEISGLDGIKEALNVKLGQAFKATSKVITNDDGLQYLDTLKDTNGNYILQPDPANPMAMRLSAGATTVPLFVLPNEDLPTSENKIPMIIGDLFEGVVFWDRRQMNIKMSDVATIGDLNAYEEDLTLFRAIEREDVTVRDEKAFVNGYISAAPALATTRAKSR